MTRRIGFLVVASVLIFSCATVPDGGHAGAPVISWPGDPTRSIAVGWHAYDGPAAIELAWPDGAVTTVTGDRTGRLSTVEVDGLEPDTRYRYRISGDDQWHEFTTMPPDETAFSFAVIGDLQPFNAETFRTTTLVMDKVASLDPLFAVQMGDIAEVGISEPSWRLALSVLSRLGAETPLVMTAGNHDYYYGVPSAGYFKRLFPAPYEDPNPRRNTWYSTTVGPVHVAILDTEAGGDVLDRQIEWLDADLRRARAEGAEWIFLVMHRPAVLSTFSQYQPWARALLPLIARHEVDAVFRGHNHRFEHSEYAYGANGLVLRKGDTPAEKPTHFFTIGTAGARVDPLYFGFFTHGTWRDTWQFYSTETGDPVTKEFVQHAWNPDRALYAGPGIRYQDPDVYSKAASYYSFPFENAADEQAGRYSSDPAIRYSSDAEFFGYTYGETSIHYLWIDVAADTCTLTVRYPDGPHGEHGEVIETPTGTPMQWVWQRE